MLVLFIEPQIEIFGREILDDQKKLNSFAYLYAEIYNETPFERGWTRNKAIDEIIKMTEMPGFVGRIVITNRPAGFSFGYDIPKINTRAMNFEKIKLELENLEINPEEVFYDADIRVLIDERRKGVATKLMGPRIFKDKKYLMLNTSQTDHQTIVWMYQRIYDNEIVCFDEKSGYGDSRTYIFNTKRTI